MVSLAGLAGSGLAAPVRVDGCCSAGVLGGGLDELSLADGFATGGATDDSSFTFVPGAIEAPALGARMSGDLLAADFGSA